ncbi:MAG TPA: hypothetical protein VFZ25_04920 [Chloroflexota bacterium]|nr:hypothetical protein [Chloroflexota bacterium]
MYNNTNRTTQRSESFLERTFEALTAVPSSVYLGLTMGSIAASAIFFLLGKRHTALFVGEWAPTFLVAALFYKLLNPSRENVRQGLESATSEFTR